MTRFESGNVVIPLPCTPYLKSGEKYKVDDVLDVTPNDPDSLQMLLFNGFLRPEPHMPGEEKRITFAASWFKLA